MALPVSAAAAMAAAPGGMVTAAAAAAAASAPGGSFDLGFCGVFPQEGFVWTQMFTAYYEWFGVAAVLLMLL